MSDKQPEQSGDDKQSEESSAPVGNDAAGENGQSDTTGTGETEPKTFDQAYVDKLRKESGDYRVKAKDLGDRAAALAAEVHEYRVKSLGLLADPSDLPYSPELDSIEAVESAVNALIQAKPHLRARRAGGDVGQAHEGSSSTDFSLLGMLKAGA